MYPLELLKLDAALGRMGLKHPERETVDKKRYRTEAGYKGEVLVDQHLRGLGLPGRWFIMRDIRLQIHQNYIAQFDTLILSERGIWILESKMVRGRLRWLENPRRLERIDEDGSILAMTCPITQLENQKSALAGWLSERGIHFPVAGVVVFGRQNVWDNQPKNAPFISVKELQNYLRREVGGALPDRGSVSVEQILPLIRANQVRPDTTPAVTLLNLRPESLKTGVLCECCFSKLTKVTQRTHVCHFCKSPVSGDPYGRALLDFVLVFKDSFTNREFCEFAEIASIATGQRYLDKYLLNITGNTNQRRYNFIPEQHLDESGKRLKRKNE
ncbi:nuclease-related domain-containing protein [Bhargavaea cecembensis]|uniref:nuclease-related domain-containing protein n=1 Tax=Bhargavaea cecembensis TaxID=394098 RepID=UPI000590217C|nr:nuclease-related domain-containing protein [Bhargavaea cecembensis]